MFTRASATRIKTRVSGLPMIEHLLEKQSCWFDWSLLGIYVIKSEFMSYKPLGRYTSSGYLNDKNPFLRYLSLT